MDLNGRFNVQVEVNTLSTWTTSRSNYAVYLQKERKKEIKERGSPIGQEV